MKKALSLILAVVLAFSMTTVAFAGVSYTYECDKCHGIITNSATYTAHVAADKCATCPHCNYGFASEEEVEAHRYDCRLFTGTCDYCGSSVNKEGAFNAHVDACKAKFFNIPVYKIYKAIENFVRTTDWNNIANKAADIVNTIKDVIAKIVPVVTDLLAKVA